jgi:multidrug efflux pump
MITATLLAIFWVPLFFVSISALFKTKPRQIPQDEAGQ